MSVNTLAKTISKIISDNNLNQQTFANSIKVSQSQVSDWIAGKSKPSFDALHEICTTFGISGDYILGLKDIEEQKH